MKLLNSKNIGILCVSLSVLMLSGCNSTEGIPSEYAISGDETVSAILPSAVPPVEENIPPIANAGVDIHVFIGDTVTLDGSASSDENGDNLTYLWTITTPSGSQVELSDTTVMNPTFIPDVVGSYTLQLVVNDGSDVSIADTMIVDAAYTAIFPISVDSFEGTVGDNDPATAGIIEVGAPLQARNIFPQGDYDWMKVELEDGKTYELFTTNLNEVGDTYLYLYDDTDQSLGNHIDSDDDYIDYDSRLKYTADRNGTYYIKIRSYDVTELTSYEVGVREYMDADNDNYSPSYDCNDNNDTIYIDANEIAGDGIDQDCDGVDAIADGTEDKYEVDNNRSSAKPIPETLGSYWETQHRQDIGEQMRTLHNTTDEDFMSVSLVAHEAVKFRVARYNMNDFDWTLYESNGTEITNGTADVSENFENDTNKSKTYYFEVSSNGSDIGWYITALHRYGVDIDGDGYYTQDWDADCNDNNASIHPGADDSNDTDGIDMNCDGLDGLNSDYDND